MQGIDGQGRGPIWCGVASDPAVMERVSPPEFGIELPLFTGPFRLLADLLLEQKMDVCDVPVAQVTDAFLARGVDSMEAWDLEEATWFLAVCAILLELKVGRLLPRAMPAEAEEDLIGGVSPDLLYARSLELAAFRMVAERLSELMAASALMVPRETGPPREFAHLYPDVMDKVTVDALRIVAEEVLSQPEAIDLSHVTPIRTTLSDAVGTLQERLMSRREAVFRELLDDCEERIEIVMRFLAILELYREGKVELSQAVLFGDIEVRWREGGRRSEGGPVPAKGTQDG